MSFKYYSNRLDSSYNLDEEDVMAEFLASNHMLISPNRLDGDFKDFQYRYSLYVGEKGLEGSLFILINDLILFASKIVEEEVETEEVIRTVGLKLKKTDRSTDFMPLMSKIRLGDSVLPFYQHMDRESLKVDESDFEEWDFEYYEQKWSENVKFSVEEISQVSETWAEAKEKIEAERSDDKEEKEDVLDGFEDVKFFSRGRPKGMNDPDSPFLNVNSGYNVNDYLDFLRCKLTEEQWAQMESLLEFSKTFQWAYQMEANWGLLQMAFGQNAEMREGYKKDKKKDKMMIENAKSPKEGLSVDTVAAKLPQAAISNECFLSLNPLPAQYEPTVYVNIYGGEEKIYTVYTTSQPVDYAATISSAQEKLLDDVEEDAKHLKARIPTTKLAITNLTSSTMDIFNDIRLEGYKNSSLTVGIVKNLQMTAAGDPKMQIKEKILPPLVHSIKKGLPSIFQMKIMYDCDEGFREDFNDLIKDANTKKTGFSDEVWEDFSTSYMNLFSSIIPQKPKKPIKSVTNKQFMFYTFKKDKTMRWDDSAYKSMLTFIIQQKKNVDELLGPDRFSYLAYYKRSNPLPGECFLTRMVNDIISVNCSLDLRQAHEYVGTGYIHTSDSLFRPMSYEGERTSIDQSYRLQYSEHALPGKAWIDYSMKHLIIFRVGGEKYSDMITYRGAGDKRAVTYIDDGITVQKQEDYINEILTSKYETYDYVGLIVPLRLLENYCETYKIVIILPAPYPAVCSAYVIFSVHAQKQKKGVAMEVAYFAANRLSFMVNTARFGSKFSSKLVDSRQYFERTQMLREMFVFWNLTITDWYNEKGKSGAQRKIRKCYDKFLSSSKQNSKAMQLTNITISGAASMDAFRKRIEYTTG